MTEHDLEISRRQLIKIGAAATVAASLGLTESSAAQPAAAAKFFTPEEFALLDELSEMIIPTDAPVAWRAGGQGRGIHRWQPRRSLG